MPASHPLSAFVPHDLREPIAGAATGPLTGLTCAVKDMYDIAGHRTGRQPGLARGRDAGRFERRRGAPHSRGRRDHHRQDHL